MVGVETESTAGATAGSPLPGGRPWEGRCDGSYCALCAGPGDGEVLEHRMTHGVTVMLCRHHRSVRFQTQGAGEDFVDALTAMWKAAGCLTQQRQLALGAHARRVSAGPNTRHRPGSYSWPEVRQEAERRWAAGHEPLQVMHELRQLHSGWSAVVPSMRTMRRWHEQARWMNPPAQTDPPGVGERTLAWIADQNRSARQRLGPSILPGWPEHDRWGRPYRRR